MRGRAHRSRPSGRDSGSGTRILRGFRGKNSRTQCLRMPVTPPTAPLDSRLPIPASSRCRPLPIGPAGCPGPSHLASPSLHLLTYFQGLSWRRDEMEYEKVLCKLQDVVHRKGHSGGVSPARWQQLEKSPFSSEDVLTMHVHTHHGHLFLRQRSVGKELLCRRTGGMTSTPAPPLT